MSSGRSSETLRTASGRQVKRPKDSEVVDILSRYAHDSDDGDDSEDEDYTARSSYSTDRQYDSSKSGESDGEEDVMVQRKVPNVSKGGGPSEEGTGGEVERGSGMEQGRQHSPAPTAPTSSSTPVASSRAQSLARSPEMVAPLMMGFGQTRSGRTVVPSENFDILYLATKFGVNPFESDESNDEDFKARVKDTTLESLSDASSEIGEADEGEMGKSKESGSKAMQEECLPVVEADQEDMDSEDAFVAASEGEGVSIEDKEVTMQACSVCLQESPSVDVVICDRCGWMTHEGCYGIAPLEGEEETKDGEEVPWFCDSCKMGEQPHCELCPNTGGLFKQVANGKWVHIVCCLYTPGVTFIEPSLLNCVVLDEILPLRWGQKACQLCSDPALAKTGVCVQCDVGMCRSAFHVTCAQKNGLLCETDISEEELSRKDSVMDAYFAHCKMHSKKVTVNRKARVWSAVAKQQQSFAFDAANVQIAAALTRMGDVYRKERERLVSSFYRPAHVDLVQERYLHTCPEAVKLFAKKAQQMGLPPPGRPAERTTLTPKPSLSLEFAQYYRDCCRNMRTMMDTLPSLVRAVGEMDVAQRELLERKSAGMVHQRQLDEEWGSLLCEATDLYTQWGVPLPAHLAKRERREENKETEGTGCCVCYLSTRQHLMVQCDVCKRHYHIDCLDPPLHAVPKKLKHYAWQCQGCCCSEEEMLKPVLAQEEERATKRGRKILKPKYYGSP